MAGDKVKFGLILGDQNGGNNAKIAAKQPDSGFYKKKFFFWTMPEDEVLKIIKSTSNNHVTWIQSLHHGSLIVSVYS